MFQPIRIAALALLAAVLPACSEQPSPAVPLENSSEPLHIRTGIREDNPTPPFYTLIQPGWFPMTDQWAAIAWIRETHCVPEDFNILVLVDPPPRPFSCPLTIEAHEIWNTNPPDPTVGPLNITARGLGAVPIWFVATSELLPAIEDQVLTIADLEAMESLLVGYADHFTLTQQTGIARGRPGEGKINITARGRLEDERVFFFQTSEGSPKKDPIAHTRIEFF